MLDRVVLRFRDVEDAEVELPVPGQLQGQFLAHEDVGSSLLLNQHLRHDSIEGRGGFERMKRRETLRDARVATGSPWRHESVAPRPEQTFSFH